jgi:predicted outer membrane repeat protein
MKNYMSYIRTMLIAEESTIDIENSTIANFFSTDTGGAIQTLNTDVDLTNCTFSGNQADEGGALYLSCDDDASCAYNFTNCTFSSNYAYS